MHNIQTYQLLKYIVVDINQIAETSPAHIFDFVNIF